MIMTKYNLCIAVLFLALPCASVFDLNAEEGRTVDVTLRIDPRIVPVPKGDLPKIDPVLNHANLIAIKQFILKQGGKQTYCQMYNDNPFYAVKPYNFYLNPDNGQTNINCDPKLSDFHELVIRNMDWKPGRDQYRDIRFDDKYYIYVSVSWPSDDLSVATIRSRAEESVKVILDEMKRVEKIAVESSKK